MIALLLSCAVATSLLAQAPPPSYALEEIIEHALEHNMDIAAARWKVAAADAQLRKAESARFLPRLRIDSESGLVPEAKGDVFNPPSDTSGVRPLGPFNRTELEFIQPIYPISRGRQLKAAAENGVDVEQADLADARVRAEYEIKKLYHGMLLAQDLNALVQRLTDELDERRDELSQSDALPISSRYKLELALLELDKQQRAATMQVNMAQRALTWRAGMADSTNLTLRARWLAPVQTEIPAVEDLVHQSIAQRPDWRKLQAGIAAKRALRKAAEGAYKPQVFIGGGLRFAIAPGRTDQRNPFVKDEFNLFNGAVFVGVRQSLEFHLLAADVARADAEYRQLASMRENARQGMQLDVRRAYVEWQRAEGDLAAAQQSRQLARQWLKEAKEEYEFDSDQLKELIAAFESWAQVERAYFQAIYDFNLSVADLEKACGGLQLSRENAEALRDE